MSYTGTVHCSYCGQRGHNRLGCPERRKKAMEDPDSYTGRVYQREQEVRRQVIAKRSCSYCGSRGHNRRGCPTLKEDKSLIIARQKTYRENFTKALNDQGLVPGSLVKVDHSEGHLENWSNKGYLALVTGVLWENVDFLGQDTTGFSRHWSPRTNVLSVRVVSTFGYSEENAERPYWHGGTPKFNDRLGLNLSQVSHVAPEIMGEENSEACKTGKVLLEVASRATVPLRPALDNLLTENLESCFHLKPSKNADYCEKSRISLKSQQWSVVRKEEHEKAVEEDRDI